MVNEEEETPQEELVENLITIISHFAGKLYGKRSHKLRRWWRVQRSSYVILSYRMRHDYDVGFFLRGCRCLLRRAIDEIWANTEWKERGRRLIPVVPKSREFKRRLRNRLLEI